MPRRITDPRRAAFSVAEMWRQARLVWRLLTDPRVPLGPKMIIPATLLYLIFPVDLVLDFLPGLGQLDDLAVLLIGLKLFIEMSPHHVVQEHLDAMAFGRRTNKGPSAKSATTIEGAYRVVDD